MISKKTYRPRWIDKLIGLATRIDTSGNLDTIRGTRYFVPKKGHKIFVCVYRDIVGEWNEVMGFYVTNNEDSVRMRLSPGGLTGKDHNVTNPVEIFVAVNLKEF